ncbi:MAG: hypothetical protein ABL960_01855, partial [Nitrospira sp.]
MPLDEQLKQAVSALCSDVEPDILQDFLSRMDREYFRRFEPAVIAGHVRLAAQLTPDHPCEVTIAERTDQHFDLTLVAYDYFSAFANICGLLSAFGLNIEEGQIYTFADSAAPAPARSSYAGGQRMRPKGRPGLSRKKIVDVFRVQPGRGIPFGPEDHRRLTGELTALMTQLDAGEFDEARQAVNRQLVEQLGKRRGSFSGLLHTVHITFDNSQSPTDTVMDIQSDDTPAFLYAFANALAMRNIYID